MWIIADWTGKKRKNKPFNYLINVEKYKNLEIATYSIVFYHCKLRQIVFHNITNLVAEGPQLSQYHEVYANFSE